MTMRHTTHLKPRCDWVFNETSKTCGKPAIARVHPNGYYYEGGWNVCVTHVANAERSRGSLGADSTTPVRQNSRSSRSVSACARHWQRV